MGIPPTPEGPSLGSASPRPRRGIPVNVVNQNPIITVDPKTVSQIGAIAQAMRGLNTEMKQFATNVAKAASAYQGLTRQISARTGGGSGGGGGGGRNPNMPNVMGAAAAGGIGAAAAGGVASNPLKILEYGYLARQIGGVIDKQFEKAALRERTSRNVAMMSPGTYGGMGQLHRVEGQLLQMGGTFGGADRWEGMQKLSQLGQIQGGPQGLTQADQNRMRQTAAFARMAGTTFTGGADLTANLTSPGTVNALQGLGVRVQPGGVMNKLGGGKNAILEQLYQRLQGSNSPEQMKELFRTGQQPGSRLDTLMGQLGMGSELKGAVAQFGAMRSERKTGFASEKDYEKEVSKRFKDAGESMRQFHEATSRLGEALSQTLIPIVTAVSNAATAILGPLGKLMTAFPEARTALLALAAAAAAAALAEKVKTAGSLGGALKSVPVLGGVLSKIPGLGALGTAAKVAAPAIVGQIAGGVAAHQGGTGEGGKRWLGKDIGTVIKYGSTGGAAGLAGGAGAFSWLTGPVGLGLGIAGGLGHVAARHAGMVGDYVGPFNDVGDVGDSTGGPPPADTPSGGSLPGRGNSANLAPDLLSRLQKMFAANPKLTLTSGWRNPEEQKYLYWKHTHGQHPAPVAKPGTSRHEKGLAADIGPNSQYGWLAANAPKFGLRATVRGEPWHWEAAGDVGKGWSPPAGDTSMAGVLSAIAAGKPTATTKAVSAGSKTANPSGLTSVKSSSSRTGGGLEEVDILNAFFGSSGGGGGGGGDTGDSVVIGTPTIQPGIPPGSTGPGVVIHKAEFNVSLARGTPEETERVARYLMEILMDRNRLAKIGAS